jgi:cell wall-associated NlpC family hydrolase
MRIFLPVIAAVAVTSCAPTVTRDEAIATAHAYTRVLWMPEDRHVRHGPDSAGIMVHTPDRSLKNHGDPKGWWQPGVEARGMPYMWGGFDTPESFQRKLAEGKKAGDIATAEKRQLLEAGVSRESTGIDCSGFVSRCWNLPQHYSTRTLHQICDRLNSWDELKPGDILLNHRHVVLFSGWNIPGVEITAYEAGPYPVWKASACGLRKDLLVRDGYLPWRYRGIRDSAKPVALASGRLNWEH